MFSKIDMNDPDLFVKRQKEKEDNRKEEMNNGSCSIFKNINKDDVTVIRRASRKRD